MKLKSKKTIEEQVMDFLQIAHERGDDYAPDFLDDITPEQARRAIGRLRAKGIRIGELTNYWLIVEGELAGDKSHK